VLFPLSYVREEPPAGVEPTPRPYKGRVLAVDTTEAKWRRRESNPLLLGANEVLFHKSFIPKVRTDGVEFRYALSYTRVYSARSSPVLSVRMTKGGRPDSNRNLEDHDLGCCRYTTATTSGDDRTRTGGLSPDKRALCSSELHPQQ
jgi:hypothetical protein